MIGLKNGVLALILWGGSLAFAGDLPSEYENSLLKAKDPAAQRLLNKGTALLKPEVIAIARKVYLCARQMGYGDKPLFTFIDYQLPSTQKRLWVVDLTKFDVLYHGLVAHGQGSGAKDATQFSNTPNSHQTSLGLYQTSSTYQGGNGYSLKLEGLEPGFNSNAMSRYIVLHGAPYVSESFIEKYGRLGRSWGCPAVSQSLVRPIINEIKEGSLLLMYYPESNWLKTSKFINCQLDAASKAKL